MVREKAVELIEEFKQRNSAINDLIEEYSNSANLQNKILSSKPGRYSLNNIYQASGENRKDLPGHWLALQQTTDLANEFLNIGNPIIKTGFQITRWMSKNIILAFDGREVVLTADKDGLFNLNKIHEASGGDSSQRPGSWLIPQQTTDLIAEFLNANIFAIKTKRGRYGGTWAIKRPPEWIRNQQTTELLTQFLSAEIPALRIQKGRGDRGAGTWATYRPSNWSRSSQIVELATTYLEAQNRASIDEVIPKLLN